MLDLLTALALMLVIEGLFLAIFPHRMRQIVEMLDQMQPELLRVAGLGAAVLGVGWVWLSYTNTWEALYEESRDATGLEDLWEAERDTVVVAFTALREIRRPAGTCCKRCDKAMWIVPCACRSLRLPRVAGI